MRKIMTKRLSIGTRRFIADEHLITSESVLTGHGHTPEISRSFFCGYRTEGLGASPVQGSTIPCVLVMPMSTVAISVPSFTLLTLFALNPLIVVSSFFVIGINSCTKGGFPIFVPLNRKLQYSKLYSCLLFKNLTQCNTFAPSGNQPGRISGPLRSVFPHRSRCGGGNILVKLTLFSSAGAMTLQ